MSKQLFQHTTRLLLLILRRDRVRIPVWIISIVMTTIVIAVTFDDLYASESERQAIAETMKNPAMTAMVGPGYGLDYYTTGAMMSHQMLLFTAVAVAIMSILLVTRHTRADEEDGRIELIRSLPTGRLAHLQATIFVMFGTNILLFLLVGFGLYALRIDSLDLHGSLLYGAVLGATGIIFTAITALFAQIAENSRGTIGLSLAVLLLAYLMRAIGDIGNETLSLVSPLGLVLRSEVYVNNYWWPVLLTLGIAVILAIVAYYLNAIRDLESGFLPSKPGKKHASVFLQSPLGLMFRLQRTGLIAWAIGMFILGASYGSVFGDLESFFEDIDIMQEFLVQAEDFSLTEQFLSMLMTVMAIICTIPVLMSLLKLTSEEKKGRTEQLLSLSVSRPRLLASTLIIAVVTNFVMLSLSGIGLWSTATVVMEDGLDFTMIYQAAIVYFPAVLVMIGITALLIGWAPTYTGWIWVYLTFSFIVVYLGGLFDFPEWLGKLSPYGHIPQLPVEEADIGQLLAVTSVAIVFIVLGFIGYRKRDIRG